MAEAGALGAAVLCDGETASDCARGRSAEGPSGLFAVCTALAPLELSVKSICGGWRLAVITGDEVGFSVGDGAWGFTG